MTPSVSSIDPEEIKRVKLLRLRMKLRALFERNPTKLVDDASSDAAPQADAAGTFGPATIASEKLDVPVKKRFNEIELRQQAKQTAVSTGAGYAEGHGLEAAALSAAYNSSNNPNQLT